MGELALGSPTSSKASTQEHGWVNASFQHLLPLKTLLPLRSDSDPLLLPEQPVSTHCRGSAWDKEAAVGLRAESEPLPWPAVPPLSYHPTGISSACFSSSTPCSGPRACEGLENVVAQTPPQTLHLPPSKCAEISLLALPSQRASRREGQNPILYIWICPGQFFQSSFAGNGNGKAQASSPKRSHCLFLHSHISFCSCIQCPSIYTYHNPPPHPPHAVLQGASLEEASIPGAGHPQPPLL